MYGIYDLTPVWLDEPVDWFLIGQAEYRQCALSDSYESQYDLCREYCTLTYRHKGRWCTRVKGHTGPHISGIKVYQEVIVWLDKLLLVHKEGSNDFVPEQLTQTEDLMGWGY